jgi:hypothetical protein
MVSPVVVGAQDLPGTDVGVDRERLEIAEEIDLLLGFGEAREADVGMELEASPDGDRRWSGRS